jgi:hypothetical protein
MATRVRGFIISSIPTWSISLTSFERRFSLKVALRSEKYTLLEGMEELLLGGQL